MRWGSLDVQITPDAPAAARRWLDALPHFHELGQDAFDARLLVTELVANSVQHAGLGPGELVRVRASLAGCVLRIEVEDAGPGFATFERRRSPTVEGGRGLELVAVIATRWGVERNGRTVVWFEMEVSGVSMRHGAMREFPSESFSLARSKSRWRPGADPERPPRPRCRTGGRAS